MTEFQVAMILLVVAALFAAAACALVVRDMRKRNMHLWLGHYLRRRSPVVEDRPVHVMFCFVDHFEPMWKGGDLETQRRRVDRWCAEYRAMAGRHRDADGRPPQHSFFYPEEEYAEEHLAKLSSLHSDDSVSRWSSAYSSSG